MKEIILALMLVASRLSGLPATEELPVMAFLPQDQMCVAVGLCESDQFVYGHYNMQTRMLTLPTGWSPASVQDRGDLVHELVHHLQAVQWPKKEDRPCDGRLEEQAYETERQFLALFGAELDVDPMILLFLTSCYE